MKRTLKTVLLKNQGKSCRLQIYNRRALLGNGGKLAADLMKYEPETPKQYAHYKTVNADYYNVDISVL